MAVTIKRADFCGSWSSIVGLPKDGLPEVAVIGRSNVGKSSFVNRIACRKGLAKTSQTPGRTQALVGFRLCISQPRVAERNLLLVDLPGFGYAKLNKNEQARLHHLIAEYISKRERLKVLCLLNDCRRDPEEDEIYVRDLAVEAGAHLLVVISKIDKLKANERKKRVAAIASLYGLEEPDVIVTGEGEPPNEFWRRVEAVLG